MSKKYSQALISLTAVFLLLSFLFQSHSDRHALEEDEKLIQNSLLTHHVIHKDINTASRPELYRLKEKGILYGDYFSAKTMSFSYPARGIKNLKLNLTLFNVKRSMLNHV